MDVAALLFWNGNNDCKDDHRDLCPGLHLANRCVRSVYCSSVVCRFCTSHSVLLLALWTVIIPPEDLDFHRLEFDRDEKRGV